MYEAEYSPNAVDQHQQLLLQGRFSAPPTSAAHLAGRMEAGGAKIEETLHRLNCKYQTLFFTAGWAVIAAAAVSIVNSIMTLSIATLGLSTFLLLFGFVAVVTDVPGSPRWAGRYRLQIRKHARLLTRITGKSLAFLFLSCMVVATLWPSGVQRRPGSLVFTSISLSIFVALVALVGLMIAIRKSLRLEKVRKALQVATKGNSPQLYRKYAITDPTHGLQCEEFNRLCCDYTQARIQFETPDLVLVYNALDEHQKSAINEREFTEWMAGPMTYL